MICSKNLCTGCAACYNICPKNAISMEKDSYGNIYPKIDENKCINCGLCRKVCPSLKDDIKFFNPIETYALYNKNSQKRSESTSGGAATLLYENILEQGGIVYGASNLFGESEFRFIRIDKKDDLYKIKGSKYVHCFTNDIYKKVKNDLLSDKKVLFIGTPCQVVGLKTFLMKDYDNLLTADIICHGVPSQQLLFDELKSLNINIKNVAYVFFRDDKLYNFKVFDNEKNVLYENSANNVDYCRNFLQGNFYRENCYECRYAKKERVSDLTLGDFWGLSRNSKIYDDENKGISVVLVNTQNGANNLNKILNQCKYEKRTLEEACKTNGQLNHPMVKKNSYKKYVKYYTIYGYKKTMKKMFSTKSRIFRILKNNKTIYNIVKRIKNK